jgi:hypothetical protein
MSDDDFDNDGLAQPVRPLHPRAKRVKVYRHSQRTVVELDGPYGPIHIDSTSIVTVEIAEEVLPPHRLDGGFAQPSLRPLSKARKQ